MKHHELTQDFDTVILLSRLKDDDQAAFAEIVRALSGELFVYAVKLTRCKDDAEDLLQDLFADLWIRRHKLEVNSSLKAYLYTALKRRFLRKVMRSNLNESALDHLKSKIQVFESTVLDLMVAAELEGTIDKAVNKLPAHMQKIFALRGQDYSIKEIAAALGLAEQTVKTYNMHAKRSVKEAILAHHPDISHSLLLYILVSLTIN